jgi:hypothetical protein
MADRFVSREPVQIVLKPQQRAITRTFGPGLRIQHTLSLRLLLVLHNATMRSATSRLIVSPTIESKLKIAEQYPTGTMLFQFDLGSIHGGTYTYPGACGGFMLNTEWTLEKHKVA